MQKIERNYGIDLLKVLLSIMVITIHINANGTGQVLQYATESPWKLIITIVTTLCYPAVNTYILITGYYSYEARKDCRGVIKSLSSLWLSALFFSLFGYFASVIGFNSQFHVAELLKRFFPIIRGVWWFYTVYFALMLISPFLNKMLDNLSRGEHKLLLLFLIMMLSIFPVFVGWKGQLGSNYGYSLIWFVTLYLTGAFLKRINISQFETNLFLLGGIGYGGASVIMCLWPKVFGIVGIQSTVYMYNSLFCYAQSIFLFMAFVNIRIISVMKRFVECISPVILASYLLHCQEDIEKILWIKIHPSCYANSSEIIFVAIVIVVAVIFVSIILETLRKKICQIFHIDKKFAELIEIVFDQLEQIFQIERN